MHAAIDGDGNRGKKAKEDGESAKAWRRLRVDAALGGVVHGVETYGQALCRRRADKGHDKRGCRHENIWKEGFHAKSNAPIW